MKARIFTNLGLNLFVIALIASTSFGQRAAARVTTRQMETLLIRIDTKIGILKDEVARVAERSPGGDDIDTLADQLTDLEQGGTKLQDAIDAGPLVSADVTDVLTLATQVDQFLLRTRVSPSAQSQWKSLKRDYTTLATYNRLSWNWTRPVVPGTTPAPPPITGPAYTATDTQMRTLLSRVNLKAGIYRTQMASALRSDTSADLADDAVSNYITRFETAVNRLQQGFESRQSRNVDATELMTAATYLDQFMSRNELTPQAQAQWRNLRGDLNTLATYYRLSWNWNQTLPNATGVTTGGVGLRNFDRRITGTYRLNTSLSEDPTTVVNRAVGSASTTIDRDNLERRLRSPEMIAIEMTNKKVSMASTILPQVTFEADGVARTETNARNRRVTTTATVDEDGLIINYQGERASDFYLTFLPMADGKLKVTRRIYLDNSNESITVSSTYDKVDTVARWANVSRGDTGAGTVSGVVQESYVVPSGTRLSGELQDAISGSPVTERFSITVTTPGQYRGALIGGRVLAEDAASRMAGRSRVLLAFDTIRLTDGRTYRFTGSIDALTAVNGDVIQVSNQTASVRPTTQPRGTGGILGALIGAIAGVPVNNAGTAASTSGAILTQRGEMMNLEAGSQVVLTATSPLK